MTRHATLLPADVRQSVLISAAIEQARLLLDDLASGDSYTPGQPVHPGGTFGRILAWLWSTDVTFALPFLTDLIAAARAHSPVAVRLDDVLDGLHYAWPPHCPRAELEVIIAMARARPADVRHRPQHVSPDNETLDLQTTVSGTKSVCGCRPNLGGPPSAA